MSLKEAIINNEKLLLDNFSNEYGLHIKYFIAKIQSLPKDGDIVKFLNNPSIRHIKKKQYDLFHNRGFRTAIDIMNDYDLSDLECTTLENLEVGELVNALTICAMANNFNHQKGMYYNEKDDILFLKTQLKNGQYGDRWIKRNRELLYYLQTEKEELFYTTKKFSHKPNLICRDIIEKINNHTKVYLFYRYNGGNRYFYDGQYAPIEFVENNRVIVLKKLIVNAMVSNGR